MPAGTLSLQSVVQQALPSIPGGPSGPLSTLEGASPFDFSSTTFPLDLGSDQKGHYIIFNINVQDSSAYNSAPGTSGVSVRPSGSQASTPGVAQSLQNA